MSKTCPERVRETENKPESQPGPGAAKFGGNDSGRVVPSPGGAETRCRCRVQAAPSLQVPVASTHQTAPRLRVKVAPTPVVCAESR